ncbi:hypothetical protein CERZMDRAFT_48195 [Cercospora zeae-maydis SCOH1-5]|uniref:Protein kinase domain-containing protein n=1 Tax=Cercospora zeae-maydis SCOH1-5 TaxID=717836 RepID=A0A6A6F6R5_9PEZI|nr:hypothetical protein CERZMDRAFT_48195 [Cercospora zeae-maydis SCOH1-5]
MASTSQSTAPGAVPAGTKLLLTDALHRGRVFEPGSPASLLTHVALGTSSQVQSRYTQDFDEIGLLGKGGFGEKIPIRDSTMKRIVAGGQDALDELLAEVRSLSKLQHPNVVTRSVTDFTNGAILTTEPTLTLHLQMSVHPMTLSEFLSPPQADSMVKPLAHCFHLEPSIRILLALLDGVDYLHSQGVVHRDLKPANIFLRHEESPKSMHGCVELICIGDFGLVTQIAEPSAPPSPAVTAVGTEIYRPTSATSPASPRLDIFALGIVACELLCKFGTQMERRQTLQALRKGAFPTKFASCAGHQSAQVRECVAAMLSDDAGDGIWDLKRRLSDLLEHSQKIDSKEIQRRFST